MDLKNILVVAKLTKYEFDQYHLHLKPAQVLEKYRKEGIDAQRILNSHERQKKALQRLKDILGGKNFISRDEFTRKKAAEVDLVISFGGDNHFQYLSHFLEKTPLLGINSDPVKSEGALTSVPADKIERVVERLKKEQFSVESWTRLSAQVNGEKVTLATSEYFLGERDREEMSRHILEFQGKKEEQKGSGILVATGIGSMGWYHSACRFLHPSGDIFPQDAPFAKFLLTEPHKGNESKCNLFNGVLRKGEKLVLHSLNDAEGRLSVDSWIHYPFNRGANVEIRLADLPLKVVKISQKL